MPIDRHNAVSSEPATYIPYSVPVVAFAPDAANAFPVAFVVLTVAGNAVDAVVVKPVRATFGDACDGAVVDV